MIFVTGTKIRIPICNIIIHPADIVCRTGPHIVFRHIHNSCAHRISLYISAASTKILTYFYRLAFITILPKHPARPMATMKVLSISLLDSGHKRPKIVKNNFNQHVIMV